MTTTESEASEGRTTIADSVVAKVVGVAARQIAGVYALGGGGARAMGAIREAVNAPDLTQGVKVDVTGTQVSADLTIVVEYPSPIQDVADNVRAAVTTAITDLLGMQVGEVNITVDDVHLAEDDSNADIEPSTP